MHAIATAAMPIGAFAPQASAPSSGLSAATAPTPVPIASHGHPLAGAALGAMLVGASISIFGGELFPIGAVIGGLLGAVVGSMT